MFSGCVSHDWYRCRPENMTGIGTNIVIDVAAAGNGFCLLHSPLASLVVGVRRRMYLQSLSRESTDSLFPADGHSCV